MTQLTVTNKLRNLTLRSSDLQSDGDLDSIRNSCDIFSINPRILTIISQYVMLNMKPLHYSLLGHKVNFFAPKCWTDQKCYSVFWNPNSFVIKLDYSKRPNLQEWLKIVDDHLHELCLLSFIVKLDFFK